MAGAPDVLAADVEKLLVDDGVAAVARGRPKEAERATVLARGAAVKRTLRSCLDAVRRLRLTAADMIQSTAGGGDDGWRSVRGQLGFRHNQDPFQQEFR